MKCGPKKGEPARPAALEETVPGSPTLNRWLSSATDLKDVEGGSIDEIEENGGIKREAGEREAKVSSSGEGRKSPGGTESRAEFSWDVLCLPTSLAL